VNILTFDIEHSENVFKPWEDGFYVSCIGIIRSDGVREVIWCEHSSIPEDKQVSWWESDSSVMERVREHVEWADIVIAHNMKHDMTLLRYYGISFEKVKLWCTMVAEYILSGQDTRQRTFGLSAVAQHYGFPAKLDKVKALWDMGKHTYDIHSDLLDEYVMDDCQKTYDIYQRQVVEVERQKMQKVIDLQMEWTLSLSDMELGGFLFDRDRAQEIVNGYETEMDKLSNEIKQFVILNYDPSSELLEQFNPNSSKQVSAYLFGGSFTLDGLIWTQRELKHETKYYQKKGDVEITMEGLGFVPPTKKRNQNGSVPVNKTTISQLRGKTPEQKIVLSALTQYSKIKKAKETLVGKSKDKGLLSKIKSDGMIHPNFNQCVATTGRLTSSNPNGQNLPRGTTSPVKQCIISSFLEENACILQIDLSQIEWRAAAWLSQDPVMIEEINSGVDQHTAACISPDLMNLPFSKENRFKTKIFNFRMIYRGQAYGFYMDNNMPNFTLKRWSEICTGFFNKYYGLDRWHYESQTHVMLEGEYTLPTGRKFIFIKDDNMEYSERKIANYPVQGLAGADILPLLGVMIRRGLKSKGLKSKYILTVHDSLVLDVCSGERSRVKKLIANCVASLQQAVSRYYNIDWNVRLEGEIEYGKNYGELGHTVKC
jgi:DNA polymerase-1